MHHADPTAEKQNFSKRFIISLLLNVVFVLVEIFYGIKSNSVMLISDALHNAGDCITLLIAWGSLLVSDFKTSDKFTYGFKNTTILAAFINAIIVFMAVGGICWEAYLRIGQPETIHSNTVILVASMGVLINGISALLFMSGKNDLNIWAAFIHMAADALISLGVILSALLIIYTGWFWIDPIVSILISILIAIGSWNLFKESTKLILLAVPQNINIHEIKECLLNQPSITAIHDLHIWALSTTETALSVHLLSSKNELQTDLLYKISALMEKNFKIHHSTIQLEYQASPVKCENDCL